MEVIILGCGAFSREAFDWCEQSVNCSGQSYKVAGFYSSTEFEAATLRGVPIYNKATDIPSHLKWVIGVGSAKVMQKLVAEVSQHISPADPVVHPSVVKGCGVTIGSGSIICPNVTLTCDINIGSSVIVNIGCTIGHDCVIGNYVHVSPNTSFSGNSNIGDFCEIGTGAITIPHVTVPNNCIIGAGALLTKSITIAGTYVGSPARRKLGQ